MTESSPRLSVPQITQHAPCRHPRFIDTITPVTWPRTLLSLQKPKASELTQSRALAHCPPLLAPVETRTQETVVFPKLSPRILQPKENPWEAVVKPQTVPVTCSLPQWAGWAAHTVLLGLHSSRFTASLCLPAALAWPLKDKCWQRLSLY